MIIRYYKNDGTLIKEVEISNEEEKALSVVMADISDWHENFLKHRIRQEVDNIVGEALKPGSKLLKESDKQRLRELLNKHNILVADPRSLPYEIKKEIVKRANLELLKPKETL